MSCIIISFKPIFPERPWHSFMVTQQSTSQCNKLMNYVAISQKYERDANPNGKTIGWRSTMKAIFHSICRSAGVTQTQDVPVKVTVEVHL